MKALILNSGIGKRMGGYTKNHPKCMTEIYNGQTILSHQLNCLKECKVNEVVITTGRFDIEIIKYCNSLNLGLQYTFINNPLYENTNYIYSIYIAKEYLNDDILLMHGDLVFEVSVLQDIISFDNSCMTVSTSIPLPLKDFKAVIKNNLIQKIGIEFFDDAVAAQPLYKINKGDWLKWLNSICEYCENGQVNCYAENAFNNISKQCHIYPLDFKNRLCSEIDTPEDLSSVKNKIEVLESKRNGGIVYGKE